MRLQLLTSYSHVQCECLTSPTHGPAPPLAGEANAGEAGIADEAETAPWEARVSGSELEEMLLAHEQLGQHRGFAGSRQAQEAGGEQQTWHRQQQQQQQKQRVHSGSRGRQQEQDLEEALADGGSGSSGGSSRNSTGSSGRQGRRLAVAQLEGDHIHPAEGVVIRRWGQPAALAVARGVDEAEAHGCHRRALLHIAPFDLTGPLNMPGPLPLANACCTYLPAGVLAPWRFTSWQTKCT